MNPNPFNFQKTLEWGGAGVKHLKNMAQAHKMENSNRLAQRGTPPPRLQSIGPCDKGRKPDSTG